ncbi:MAG: phosphopantetheine-binding protein [bacterium]
MGRNLSEAELEQIRNSFRRCNHETIEAIVKLRQTGDSSLIPTIVYGIIERYAPAGSSKKISELPPNTRLIEDLAIDSLTMLEVVLSIEEALQIRIENEELPKIRTLEEVKTFITEKNAGVKSTPSTPTTMKLDRSAILAVLPQQPPFLFLNAAEIEGETIRARYKITGEEYFLQGHFKGNPVFPASLVFEAMGQAACLWLLGRPESQSLDSKNVLFGSMESAHFYRKAKPGETIELEISLSKLRKPLAIFNGKASVNGEKLSSIEELVIVFGEATEGIVQHEATPPAASKPSAKTRS